MKTHPSVNNDAATVQEIDEALANLRESIRAFDGDTQKQRIVLDYVDDLLDQRHAIAHA